MEICDFSRSFIRWGIDTQGDQSLPLTVSHEPPFTLNLVRVMAECHARVTDRETGNARDYLLGASCKTERVNVERDIWTDPNADFCPIASEDTILNFKRWDRCDKGAKRYPESLGDQPERQMEIGADVFCQFGIEIRKCRGEPVPELDDLISCLESGTEVFAQTVVEAEHYTLELSYPVKTGNFSPRDRYYQVDTGPVLFPDLSCRAKDVHSTFELAYVAHKDNDWAEFLVCCPTPLNDDLKVYHYSKPVRVDCRNSMIAIRR